MNLTTTLHLVCAIGLSAMLTACGGSSGSGSDPLPRHARGAHPNIKIGKTYRVNGNDYTPAYEPSYDKSGTASWYGPGFHGRSTANGEKFNENDLTAAHPTLPMPSFVRVTNLSNDRSIVVRINDRGPFHSSRIIDLSKAAARELDILRTGTARVRVQYLPDETNRYLAQITGGRVRGYDVTPELKNSVMMAEAGLPATIDQSTTTAAAYDSVSSADLAPPPGAKQVAAVNANPELAPAIVPPQPATLSVMPQAMAAPLAEAPSAVYTPSVAQAPVTTAPVAAPSPPPLAEAPGIDVTQVPENPRGGPHWFVQLGSFSVQENAKRVAEKFGSYATVNITEVFVDRNTWYRVRLGPLADDVAAEELLQRVNEMGHSGAQIVKI